MKKILISIITLAASLGVSAQGLVNFSSNFTPTGGTHKAFIYNVGGAELTAAVGKVEVVDSTGKVIVSGSINEQLPGIFTLGAGAVPGTTVGTGSADVIIRAWDTSGGHATYADALASGSSGFQAVHLTSFGGGTTPAVSLKVSGNFTGFTLTAVPEPSTIALAALGLAGLVFVARRK